ncbi:hypothetical protein M5D96_009906, partial [Drosophila gunungcola]
ARELSVSREFRYQSKRTRWHSQTQILFVCVLVLALVVDFSLFEPANGTDNTSDFDFRLSK